MNGLYQGDCKWVGLEQFVEYCLPSVPNAPESVVAHYVRTSAIEFCKRTSILRDRTTIQPQAGVVDYALEPVAPALSVHAVDAVYYAACRLDRLASLPPSGGVVQGGYFYAPPRDLWIYSQNQSAAINTEIVTVDVVLIPGQDATEVPEYLYNDFAETLADGALQRLLLMKTADWFDPKAAGIHLSRFRHAVSLARVENMKGHTTGPTHARMTQRWC